MFFKTVFFAPFYLLSGTQDFASLRLGPGLRRDDGGTYLLSATQDSASLRLGPGLRRDDGGTVVSFSQLPHRVPRSPPSQCEGD